MIGEDLSYSIGKIDFLKYILRCRGRTLDDPSGVGRFYSNIVMEELDFLMWLCHLENFIFVFLVFVLTNNTNIIYNTKCVQELKVHGRINPTRIKVLILEGGEY